MAGTPNFTGNDVRFGCVEISAAVTWSGTQPTNATLLLTLPSAPNLLASVQVKGSPVVNTTAGQIYFFLYDGTNYYLVKEVVVTAISVAAGTAAFDSGPLTFGYNGAGWPLPDHALAVTGTPWKLYCASNKAEHFFVTAQAGAF